MLSDSVERSPLSKKKDRGGVGRKSNSNRDEIVRIEQSSANREIMRDALWDAKNISFDSSNKYDRAEKREIGRSSRGHGPTQRSDRHNDRGGEEDEDDDILVRGEVQLTPTIVPFPRGKENVEPISI